jgi:hypothetical protein
MEKEKVMPKTYELIEIFKAKASMSADIVSRKDPEYAYYSGASFEIASKIAMIDTLLKNKLIPENFIVFVKLYRSYLDQQRKAFFASVGSTEITKLGFIQGDTRRVVSAKAQTE